MRPVACLLCLGLLVGPARAGAPPDEDRDEEDLAAIKAALLLDQRVQPAPPPPPPPSAAATHPAAWLPELSATSELLLHYGEERPPAGEELRGLVAPAGQGGPGPVPAPGATLRLELGLQHTLGSLFQLHAFALAGPDGLALLEATAVAALPWKLQLRGGLLRHRFGVQNAWHAHALSQPLRPLSLSRTFGEGGGRGLGLEASWRAPLPWLLELSAAALGATGADAARSFYGDRAPGGLPGPQDLLYVVTLKQHAALTRSLGSSLGLSAALGPNATGRSNRTDVYGADLALRLRARGVLVDLLAEWLWRRQQVPGGLLSDVSGYTELGLGGALLPAGSLGLGLGLRLRHEYLGPAPEDPRLGGERHRLAATGDLRLGRGALLRASGAVDLGGGALLGYAALLVLQLRLGPHGTREVDPHGLVP